MRILTGSASTCNFDFVFFFFFLVFFYIINVIGGGSITRCLAFLIPFYISFL